MMKSFFFPLFTPRNICCGYLLELPHWGDSNKYPQHMFLRVLNTVFLNISNYLPHLEQRNRPIQIVVITNFIVISSVGIKRFDCTMKILLLYFLFAFVHQAPFKHGNTDVFENDKICSTENKFCPSRKESYWQGAQKSFADLPVL